MESSLWRSRRKELPSSEEGRTKPVALANLRAPSSCPGHRQTPLSLPAILDWQRVQSSNTKKQPQYLGPNLEGKEKLKSQLIFRNVRSSSASLATEKKKTQTLGVRKQKDLALWQ